MLSPNLAILLPAVRRSRNPALQLPVLAVPLPLVHAQGWAQGAKRAAAAPQALRGWSWSPAAGTPAGMESCQHSGRGGEGPPAAAAAPLLLATCGAALQTD